MIRISRRTFYLGDWAEPFIIVFGFEGVERGWAGFGTSSSCFASLASSAAFIASGAFTAADWFAGYSESKTFGPSFAASSPFVVIAS
jgi:hypothetical protein